MNIVFCIILLILIIIISTLTKSSFGNLLTTFKLGNSVVNSTSFPSITYQITDFNSGNHVVDLTNNSANYIMNFPGHQTDRWSGLIIDSDRDDFCVKYLYKKSPNGNINNNVKVSAYNLVTGDMINLTTNVLGNLNMNITTSNVPFVSTSTDYTLSAISNNNSITFEQNENGKYIILIGLETQVPVSAWQPTVYLYKTSSFRQQTCSVPNPTDAASCMSIPGSNIMDNQSCENCEINLELNGVVPDQLKISLNNFNVSGMFPGTDGMYIEPQLFINNSSINGYINYQDLIKFLSDKIMFTRGADFIKRIDAILSNDKNDKYFIVYYTTLDNSFNYVSDSAIILNGSTIITSSTNKDVTNKLSDKHIKLTGGNCTGEQYYCGPEKHIGFTFLITLPWGDKIQIDGKDFDYQNFDFGYLHVFGSVVNCQIDFKILGWGPGKNSGYETFPLNSCLAKNLSRINLSYYYNNGGRPHTRYMQAKADLYDNKDNLLLTRTSAADTRTESGC